MGAAVDGSAPVPPPFPFIVGVGRSGTTLLRTILDAHPDLAVVHESRFVGHMAQHRLRYEPDGALRTDRFLSDLLDPGSTVPSRLDAWNLDPDAIRDAISAAAPSDLAGAVRTLYGLYAAQHGAGRYGDKTPGYIRSLPAIAGLLPEATFVHLVRDGRDVALSMLDVDFGGVNVPHAAWLWSNRVRAAERAGAQLGPDRYLVVRYEDLVGDPHRVLSLVCDHVRLPFDPVMLEYFERPERVTVGLGAQPHHGALRLPITAGLRDWRAQMRPAEVAQFERVAGPLLAELGYDCVTAAGPAAGPGPVDRARIAEGRAVAAWRSRRRARLHR